MRICSYVWPVIGSLEVSDSVGKYLKVAEGYKFKMQRNRNSISKQASDLSTETRLIS